MYVGDITPFILKNIAPIVMCPDKMAEDLFPAITFIFLPNYLGVYQICDVKADPRQHVARDRPSRDLIGVLLR